MVDRREVSRRKARERRIAAKQAALDLARGNCELAASALMQARRIVSEPAFKALLVSRNIQSMPECLVYTDDGASNEQRCSELRSQLERTSLEFAVAWRFLYPLLRDSDFGAYLDREHQAFVPALKDAFIALVVDGPFPNVMSGHQGRKRKGKDFGRVG